MNYWLTTHWPQLETDKEKDYGTWVPNGKEAALEGMRERDQVFVYETKNGPTSLVTVLGQGEERRRRLEGRQGVIALAEIAGLPCDMGPEYLERYVGGRTMWWRYKAEAKPLNTRGFVGRERLATMLGYEPSYSFRGFGNLQSGVKRLAKDQFDAIHAAYLESIREPEHPASSQSQLRYGVGGEGPIHRSLKEYIGRCPSEALKEEGLSTVKVEYDHFPTGDSVDVLLRDRHGRYLTVEVEVDCNDEEEAGPLQCMKYRALVAYWYRCPVGEVRTLLAARSITKTLKDRCAGYGIEAVEIPTWPGCDER